MKPGREYETFIFETFRAFFPKFTVVKNDKILGKESGIHREIDVSIRGLAETASLLYVVQAKDHARPADIKIVGEFSSVVRDVGASKGILICASGFAKTIKDYARTLGIELLTVEDINSKRWTANIEIPVARIHYETTFQFVVEVIASDELIELNREKPLNISLLDDILLSADCGMTFAKPQDQLRTLAHSLDLKKPCVIKIPNERLRGKVLGCDVAMSNATFTLNPQVKRFFKFLKPNEYRVIKNHLNETVLPIRLGLSNFSLALDETWQSVPDSELPVQPAGLHIQIEFNPDTLGEVDRSKSTGSITPVD